MADSLLADVLMGIGQGVTKQPFLTNYNELKQKAQQWRDEQAYRQAQSDYMASQGRLMDTRVQMDLMDSGFQPTSSLIQQQTAQLPPQAAMSMIGGGVGTANGAVLPNVQDPVKQIMANATTINTPYGQMSRPGDFPVTNKMTEHQDLLESKGDAMLKTMYSSRSGVLGTNANKVDQAIMARQLVNNFYDPKTGQYNLQPQQYHELALSLASLLAPNAVATDAKMQALIARTAEGDINGFLQYISGSPKNASSQEMLKSLIGSIDREGLQAEANRDKHLDSLKNLLPTGLAEDRKGKLLKQTFGTSYKDFLSESPDQKSADKSMGTTPSGIKYKVIK